MVTPMPDQRPVYLPMRSTNRLSRRQAELIIKALSSIKEGELYQGQELKTFRRGFTKLVRAWIKASSAEEMRMEENSATSVPASMHRKPHGFMPSHWRKTLKDFAPLGSAREWSVAMGIHYSTFIRTFKVRDHSFSAPIRRPEGSGFPLYEARILEMRRLLHIQNAKVEAPFAEPDHTLTDKDIQGLTQPRPRPRVDHAPYGSAHPDLAFSLKAARDHWGSRQMRVIAFATYQLDDEAMEVIHPLTWAR